MSNDFAPPLSKLSQSGIGVAAVPSGGKGLALTDRGKVPAAALDLPWIDLKRDCGATGDGSSGSGNDDDAFKAALSSGRPIFVPPGTYLVDEADITTDGTVIAGAGRNVTIIKGRTNSKNVVHLSASYCTLRDFTIDGDVPNRSSMVGLAVTPADESQQTTVVNQNYNVLDINVRNCTEGVILRCGPTPVATDSGCWYNEFYALSVLNCVRGIWLRDTTESSAGVGSSANRNRWFGGRCGQSAAMNTGVQIDAANTCQFFGMAFEGITVGASPNATPTALLIADTSTKSAANNWNGFHGCNFETNTRDIDNSNNQTMFFGCDATTIAGSKDPLVYIGYDGVNQRQPNLRIKDFLTVGTQLVLPTYTTAALPGAAAVGAGTLVYVSDAAAGNKLQYSNGAAWVAAG